MNANALAKTMIEYIKYEEDIENKNELLTILRCSMLLFDKTRSFATKNINSGKILTFECLFLC